MQYESRGTLRFATAGNSLVKLLVLSFLKTRRLLGREITAHGERGVRQENRVFVALSRCAHTRATIHPYPPIVNLIVPLSTLICSFNGIYATVNIVFCAIKRGFAVR